jgi:hypothetical protein
MQSFSQLTLCVQRPVPRASFALRLHVVSASHNGLMGDSSINDSELDGTEAEKQNEKG